MGYILKCNKCGYERLITVEWLIDLRRKLLSTGPVPTIENLSELIPRFQCSKCNWKDARILREKEPEKKRKYLPKSPKKLKGSVWRSDLTRWNPPSESTSQTKPTYKKTCHFCNGTGANGNCFHCGGTGWD
jgi:hypothetical protein